jgi:hypothetical protein
MKSGEPITIRKEKGGRMKASLRLVIFFGVIFVISVPSWADTINVCYNTRNGDIRYVADPSDCRRNENPLLLNTEGPAGSDGISCWDLDSSGTCNGDEDKDGSGVCDALDCQGPEGPPGPTGSFDLSKIYVNFCGGIIDDGVRLVECLCDDDGSKAISGGVSCGQFWYPISSGPYYSDGSCTTDDLTGCDNPDGWTALCKHLTEDSIFGPDTSSVTCIRP